LTDVQGPHGKLSATATSLRQLDLTDNLIGGWSTVVSICQQLPQLQLLNLSLNRLQLLSSLPDAGLQQLPGLQCLVLNSCNITWQQVWAPGSIEECTSRPEPQQCTNKLADVGHLVHCAPDASCQQTPPFHAVCRVVRVQVAVLQSSLPNLQELHVAGNSISSLLVRRDQPSHDQQQQQQQHDWPPLEGFRSLQVGSSCLSVTATKVTTACNLYPCCKHWMIVS
jgi:Leucine-rich repeat (LRR) protein